MINLIIPLFFAAAMICIIYYLANEWIRERRLRQISEWFEQKKQNQIEDAVRKTIAERADYWDNFNTGKYVEYLENKENELHRESN